MTGVAPVTESLPCRPLMPTVPLELVVPSYTRLSPAAFSVSAAGVMSALRPVGCSTL
jgi:hypothetical protein